MPIKTDKSIAQTVKVPRRLLFWPSFATP